MLMSVYRRFSVDDGQRRQRRFKKCAVSNENAFGVDGNFENHEQLKYAPIFYRIMTNQRVESLVMKGNWEQIRFL